jgi:hypothetical protein
VSGAWADDQDLTGPDVGALLRPTRTEPGLRAVRPQSRDGRSYVVVGQSGALMQTHLGTGGCTNGMDPELTDWQTAYHGENHPRTRRVKAACDPDDLFAFPRADTCGRAGR